MAFHWRNGWYFERVTKRDDGKDDGTVRVYHTPHTDRSDVIDIPDVILEIDADSWASIIASVSYSGEGNGRFYKAARFHNESDFPTAI